MITSYDNLVVICKNEISIKVAKRDLVAFEKNKMYNCVYIEEEYRVYGDEFIFHGNKDDFIKHFKVVKSHIKVAKEED